MAIVKKASRARAKKVAAKLTPKRLAPKPAATRVAVREVVYEGASEFVTVSPERYQEWSALTSGDDGTVHAQSFAGTYVRIDPLDAPDEDVRTVRRTLIAAGAAGVRIMPSRRAEEVPTQADEPQAPLPTHREVVLTLARQATQNPDVVAACCERAMNEAGV